MFISTSGRIGHKKCSKCKEEKPCEEFYSDPRMKDGLHSYCKKCNRIQAKRWQQTNPERACKRACKWKQIHPEQERKRLRRRNLRINYNISEEEYDLMLEQQKGVCAICGEVCKTGHRLSVDHDHRTGEVRGLLCRSCNLKLGWFESKEHKILKYLKSRC